MIKFVIILNTIIPIIACVHVCRALIISYTMQIKMRSIKYELSEDKVLYEKGSRLYMYLLLMSNGLWCMWSISRMANNWVPYPTPFIAFTAVLFSLILYFKSQLLVMALKGSGFKFLKYINLM